MHMHMHSVDCLVYGEDLGHQRRSNTVVLCSGNNGTIHLTGMAILPFQP